MDHVKPSAPIGSVEARSSSSQWGPIPTGTGADFSSIFWAVVQSVAASDGHSTFKSVGQAALPASSGEAVEGGGAVGGIILNQNKDIIERYHQNPMVVPIAMKQSLAYNGTICSNISTCTPCNIPSVPQEFYLEILDKKFIKERREEIRRHHGLAPRDPTVPHMHQGPLLIT